MELKLVTDRGSFDAIIVGGGIAGLVSAIAINQRGGKALIVEKATGWTPKGAGIHLYSNALRALDAIGVAETVVAQGSGHEDYLYADRTDTHEVKVTYPRLAGPKLPGLCLLPRVALHNALVDAARNAVVDVRLGTTVADLTPTNDGLTVTLTDGTTADGELLVGADGIQSAMRRRVAGASDPVHTGQGIWRALLDRHPDSMHPKIMFAGGGRMFGVVPVTDDLVYLMMGRPESTGARYRRDDYVASVHSGFGDFGGLAPWYLAQITEPEHVLYTAIEEIHLEPPWFDGRILLIGDAAHASAPYLAQGAAMAIEDGVVLAEELMRVAPLSERLDRFMQRRLPRAEFIQRTSIERNAQRYQGGGYDPLPDGSMSDRMRSLSDNAQRLIDELYGRLGAPL